MSAVHSLIPTVVVFGGLYDTTSGLNVLLPALGRLQRERPVRVLWGVPEAPPREVELLGEFEPVITSAPEDMTSVVRQADILVLGQEFDQAKGLATTAIACGTAVVVARQDGGALLDAVRSVLNSRTLRGRLVQAGLRVVCE